MMSAIFKTVCLQLFCLLLAAVPAFSAAPAAYRQATDLLGRKVSVPADPRRVVALAPSITEIIFSLGQADRLKGVSQFSDYPVAAATLPKVGSYVHPDLERIVALKPDLCIAIKDGNPREIVDRLESMKIPVYAVDPRNLDSVMATVEAIGALLNCEGTAAGLVQGMRRRISRVRERISHAGRRPGVFFQIGIAPIVSVGTDSFIHQLIEMAGGKNLAAGDVVYPRFSREQVLALSPEIIIITSMARAAAFEHVKAEWSRWPSLPAARDGKIYIEDSNLFDRPSPRLVNALEVLAKRIHPEAMQETGPP